MQKIPHVYKSTEHWDDILDADFPKESDRAAVVLAAALLDTALESLLRTYLVPSPGGTDELFDMPNASLSTFSSRINMAHRVGLISPHFSRDLHIIRRIRNEFSHNVSGCTFSQSSVRSRIIELCKSSGIIDRFSSVRSGYADGPRGDFQMIVSWMLWHLNSKIEKIIPIQEAEEEWGFNRKLNSDSETELKRKLDDKANLE